MNTVKSICHVSTVHPNSDPKIYFKEVLSLAKAGYEVYYIVQEINRIDPPGNVHCLYLPKSSSIFSRLKNLVVSLNLAMRTQARIFHFHDPELLFHGLVIKILFRRKVIFDIHELTFDAIMYKQYIPYPLRKPISVTYKYLEKMCVKVFNQIILAEKYYEDYYDTSKKTIVQNFIPANYIVKQSELNKNNQTIELAYVGTITGIRGINEILKLAEILKNKINFHLHIVGEFESPGLREKIERNIGELDLHSQITIHGKKLFPEVQELLKKCHAGLIFLHPIKNYTDTLPTKLFEYMSKGLVVLMSNFPVWIKFNSLHNCGLTVDIFNLENDMHRITEFLGDNILMKAMSDTNINTVRDNYTWEREEKKLLDLYTQLLN